MILDTQFLGGLVEQWPDARSKAKERDTLREGYDRLFRACAVVDVDETLARRAGEIRGRHARSDSLSNLDGADSMVAATALAYDESVVSNDGDFGDVDGLAVETY